MLTRASAACVRSRRVYAPSSPRMYAPRPARVYARFSMAAPTLAFEPPPPEPERPPPTPTPRLSDHEWELRTGRAIYILTQTLPNFFECGLVDSLDPAAAADGAGDGAALYAPHVRLEYTPPFSLPAPLPRTFWAQGRPLYLASAVFVRHSLRALYTSLRVELTHVRVLPAPRRGTRLALRLRVSATARVSGAPAEWHVNCTYAFAESSALVDHHVIDSIEPAPHARVYNALLALIGGAPTPAAHDACEAPAPLPASARADPGAKGRAES